MLVTLVVCAGCGPSPQSQPPLVTTVVPGKEVIGSATVAGNLVNEISFHDGKGSGGEITDNVNINSIELEKEGNLEHIILGFTQRNEGSNEEPQLVAPNFNVTVQEHPYTMTFTINGARAFDAKDFKGLQKSELVADAYWLVTHDDSAWRFTIVFHSPVRLEVREYADPAQVVVSIVGKEQENDLSLYSVRTDAYLFGNELANIEENIYGGDEIRYLRDNGSPFSTKDSSYYLEIGIYETYNEAERKVEEIKKILGSDVNIFIEEK